MNWLLVGLAWMAVVFPVWAADEKPALPKVETSQPPGRFTLATAGSTIVLLDTSTGESWILSKSADGKSSQWVSIARDKQPASGNRRIPLDAVHATVEYGNLRRTHESDELYKLTASAMDNPKPRLFLVRARDVETVVKATEMAFRGAELDVPLRGGKPQAESEQYWAVLYLGVGLTPSQWLIDAIKVEDERIRVHLHKRMKGGVSFIDRPYFYWIPLGNLKSATYFLEVYDEDQARVTINQRVKVGGQ